MTNSAESEWRTILEGRLSVKPDNQQKTPFEAYIDRQFVAGLQSSYTPSERRTDSEYRLEVMKWEPYYTEVIDLAGKVMRRYYLEMETDEKGVTVFKEDSRTSFTKTDVDGAYELTYAYSNMGDRTISIAFPNPERIGFGKEAEYTIIDAGMRIPVNEPYGFIGIQLKYDKYGEPVELSHYITGIREHNVDMHDSEVVDLNSSPFGRNSSRIFRTRRDVVLNRKNGTFTSTVEDGSIKDIVKFPQQIVPQNHPDSIRYKLAPPKYFTDPYSAHPAQDINWRNENLLNVIGMEWNP